VTGQAVPSPEDGGDPVARLGKLCVAPVGDVLDSMGRRDQVLGHAIRPTTGPTRMCGRAFTITAVPSRELGDDPYAEELAAVDAIPPGSVVVIATGGACDAAIWGELLATRARVRGAVGAVIDGAVRDLTALGAMGFPTFAAGVSARDSFGRLRVVGSGGPVSCGGVAVETGDLVLADPDGVVVVPAALAGRALDAAERKLVREAAVLAALAKGAKVADTYEQFGVL
jgi:4-hydroxy-4-methyl-2-oxoglutarate aldolase